ncbi:hypothetical protein TWF173_008282 [Orbilia oligospora]|nr:hypothetical protein TWF173_008282 [Orbilia oligospora]
MPSHTEKVAELLARPLPQIIQRDDTDPENTPIDDSIHPDRVFFWDGFVEDVKKTISETDLSQDVSLTYAPEGECIIVGNRFAITGRFNANVGVPLAKAFIATSGTREELKNLRFADAEVVPLFQRFGAPDVVLVELKKKGDFKPLLKAVGEIKRFWTAKGFNDIQMILALNIQVEWISPSRDSTDSPPVYSEPALENEGQEEDDEGTENRGEEFRLSQGPTAGSMAVTTVSTEDCGDVEHEEAGPIEQALSIQNEDTPASIGHSRAQSPREKETPDATVEQSSPVQESIATAVTPADVSGKPRKISDITCRSVVFKNETDTYIFDIVETVKENHRNGKKVFRATLEGQEVVAKFWPESLFKLYTRERNTYHHLPPSPYFPQMIAYGDLILSHSLERGYILVITQEKGIQLGYKMIEQTPKAVRRRIRNALIKAVKVLRERDSMHGDPQPSNVLWDSGTGKLKLLDFEVMWENYNEDPADKVEVLGILGKIDDGDSDDKAIDVGE